MVSDHTGERKCSEKLDKKVRTRNKERQVKKLKKNSSIGLNIFYGEGRALSSDWSRHVFHLSLVLPHFQWSYPAEISWKYDLSRISETRIQTVTPSYRVAWTTSNSMRMRIKVDLSFSRSGLSLQDACVLQRGEFTSVDQYRLPWTNRSKLYLAFCFHPSKRQKYANSGVPVILKKAPETSLYLGLNSKPRRPRKRYIKFKWLKRVKRQVLRKF